MSILDGIGGILDDIGGEITSFVKTPFGGASAAAALGGVVAGTALGVGSIIKSSVTKKKTKTKRGRARDRKYISKQKHEQAYIRRKKKAGKKITRTGYKGKSYSKKKTSKRTTKKRVGKIYKTKNGQPYKIMASGKARFIKKKR